MLENLSSSRTVQAKMMTKRSQLHGIKIKWKDHVHHIIQIKIMKQVSWIRGQTNMQEWGHLVKATTSCSNGQSRTSNATWYWCLLIILVKSFLWTGACFFHLNLRISYFWYASLNEDSYTYSQVEQTEFWLISQLIQSMPLSFCQDANEKGLMVILRLSIWDVQIRQNYWKYITRPFSWCLVVLLLFFKFHKLYHFENYWENM
jgi:hypothetical protein